MRSLVRPLVVVLVVFLLTCAVFCPAVEADQNPFGPTVGRTQQVVVEYESGSLRDAYVILNFKIPDSSRIAHTTTTELSNGLTESCLYSSIQPATPSTPMSTGYYFCKDDHDYYCEGIRQIDGCNWSNLTTWARESLNFTLGSCTKQCVTTFFTPDFATVVPTYQWSCANQQQANCLAISGRRSAIGGTGDRIDVIEPASGCQF